MSDTGQQQSKESRMTEKKRFWVGVSLVIFFLFSAANIFLLFFIVPKFEQIYADALPGIHLPMLTEGIITARIAIALINLGWPILGYILLKQQKSYAILWINLGIVWAFLQIGVTIIALFMPMVGNITGARGLGEGR